MFDADYADDAIKNFMQNGSGEMDVVLFRTQNGSVTGMARENFEQQAQEFFEQTGKDFVQEMNQRGVDVFSDTLVKNGPGQEGFKSILGDSADNIVGNAADNIVGNSADNIVGNSADNIVGDSADNIIGDTVDNIRPNNNVTDLVPVDSPTIKPNTDVTDLVPVSATDNIIGDAAGDTTLAIVNKGAGEAGQGLMRQGAE